MAKKNSGSHAYIGNGNGSIKAPLIKNNGGTESVKIITPKGK